MALGILCLSFSASHAQISVSGKMSYPNNNQTAPSIDCAPISYDGNAVYEVNLTVINSANTTLTPILIGSSGFTVTTIAGKVKLYPAPVGVQTIPSNWLNHWKNGVAVDDVSTLQRHINNVEAFRCPFRALAGDVNKSGTLSIPDMTTIQNLIVNNVVPLGQPWRYISKSLVLPDFNPDPNFYDKFWSISNTFAATTIRNGQYLSYQGSIGVSSWMDYWEAPISVNSVQPGCNTSVGKLDFYAIKMGDVNGNAQIFNLNSIPFRSPNQDPSISFSEHSGTELRTTQTLLADERYEVKITALSSSESICAYQVGLKFDDKTLGFEKPKKTKERTLKQSDDNFTSNKEELDKGNFRSAWTIDYAVDKTGFDINREVELFSFNVKVKKDIPKLTEAILLDNAVLSSMFFNYDVKPIKDVKLFISIRQLQPGEE